MEEHVSWVCFQVQFILVPCLLPVFCLDISALLEPQSHLCTRVQVLSRIQRLHETNAGIHSIVNFWCFACATSLLICLLPSKTAIWKLLYFTALLLLLRHFSTMGVPTSHTPQAVFQ